MRLDSLLNLMNIIPNVLETSLNRMVNTIFPNLPKSDNEEKGFNLYSAATEKNQTTPIATAAVELLVQPSDSGGGVRNACDNDYEPGENKVQELHKPSTEEGPTSIKDDAIIHAFGLERRGRVRGLGFGALPSKVDAQDYQNQNIRKLNQKLLLLEQKLREMRAEILKGKRQNEEPSEDATGKKHSHGETQGEENDRGEHKVHGGGERGMHSQQNIWLHDANEIGNGESLDNAKCKLLNWDGTKMVVEEDTIASTNSKALVHHLPFGPGCWKVWVNHVIVNAPLFRSNREMFVLEDAIGRMLLG